MAYHYHFCAVAQSEKGGTAYCDGVFACEIALREDDSSYSDIKKKLLNNSKVSGMHQ